MLIPCLLCRLWSSKSGCAAPDARELSKAPSTSLEYKDHKFKSRENEIFIYTNRNTTYVAGVDSVEVELELEKVTVIGYVDRNKVLKAVRRAGKRAEFWPYPNPPLYFTSTNNYFKDLTSEYKESYNYYRHGYNAGDKHGNIPVSHRGDDKVSNMFNDDNVNACCLM
ncbi:hypothetical protein RJ639_010849 [Escallonia herrerae]|uniref:Uncharacterized protein n=1 Tax=Escallonia herrerae TaxID=1293975 RepID=A0AA88VPI5_9ASTE|nr:hypothetical protein RJ639_010849 [Escallonia herrerae]